MCLSIAHNHGELQKKQHDELQTVGNKRLKTSYNEMSRQSNVNRTHGQGRPNYHQNKHYKTNMDIESIPKTRKTFKRQAPQ